MSKEVLDPPGHEDPTTSVDNPTKGVTTPKHQKGAVASDAKKQPVAAKNGAAPTKSEVPVVSGDLSIITGGAVSAKGTWKMTDTSLTIISKDMTDAEFDSLGVGIGKAGTSYRFWLGDYINATAKRYKQTVALTCEHIVARIGPQYEITSLQNMASIMNQVTAEQRVEGLSFSHHEVASKHPMTPVERKKMLEKAKKEGWTVRIFSQKLNERVTGQPDPGNKVHKDDVTKNDQKAPANTGSTSAASGEDPSAAPEGSEPPAHPTSIRLSFEASQAATAATEDYNTNTHSNVTVDRYVSILLENHDNLIILDNATIDVLKALRDASPAGKDMTLAEAASKIIVKAAKAAQSSIATAHSGPPPVE